MWLIIVGAQEFQDSHPHWIVPNAVLQATFRVSAYLLTSPFFPLLLPVLLFPRCFLSSHHPVIPFPFFSSHHSPSGRRSRGSRPSPPFPPTAGSGVRHRSSARSWTAGTNASSASAAPRGAPPTGGTRTSSWGPQRSLTRRDGSLTGGSHGVSHTDAGSHSGPLLPRELLLVLHRMAWLIMAFISYSVQPLDQFATTH